MAEITKSIPPLLTPFPLTLQELKFMNRISQENTEAGVLIKIKAYYDESKQKLLNVWLFAWTLCGLAIISQFFMGAEAELKKMILIFGAFWLYFEYVVVKAFRWRKGGEEQIFIDQENLRYGRTYYNRGILKPYRLDLINPVRKITDEKNTFIKAFGDSYWVVGGEELAFSIQGKVIPFGMRLNEKEANKLIKLLNSEIQKRQTIEA